MQTGDGLLVRLTPAGTIPLDAFAALCMAAERHGNGVIEITARGNIQVRGLSVASAPGFAADIRALDIAAADGVPVLTNPLTGLDPDELFDAGLLAAELCRELAAGSLPATLSPKVSVAIDGGGSLSLDQVVADVRAKAERVGDRVVLKFALGGDNESGTTIGSVSLADGVEAVLALLRVIAQRGHEARARDVLASEGAGPFHAAFRSLPGFDSRTLGEARTVAAEVIGVHRLRDGTFALGAGLAFGHTDAASLHRLVLAAQAAGASGVRTAPRRALIVIGLARQAISSFAAAADGLGFITGAGDPRRHVVACAGAPICASAHIASRAIGPRLAEMVAPCLDGAFKIHVSGCAKGCAFPRRAALTVVGTADGCALIADGGSRDQPFTTVPTADLPAAVAAFARAHKREASDV
jgi:precorrin-3B synthase